MSDMLACTSLMLWFSIHSIHSTRSTRSMHSMHRHLACVPLPVVAAGGARKIVSRGGGKGGAAGTWLCCCSCDIQCAQQGDPSCLDTEKRRKGERGRARGVWGQGA